jgi:hypothetical protein
MREHADRVEEEGVGGQDLESCTLRPAGLIAEGLPGGNNGYSDGGGSRLIRFFFSLLSVLYPISHMWVSSHSRAESRKATRI